jgi:hypothetical protein
MQVRMPTFEITEQDRRAIRFAKDKRKTMCSRKEAQEFIQAAVDRAVRDLRYRWYGPQVSEAVLNGADPEGLASQEKPAATVSADEENVSDQELASANA